MRGGGGGGDGDDSPTDLPAKNNQLIWTWHPRKKSKSFAYRNKFVKSVTLIEIRKIKP